MRKDKKTTKSHGRLRLRVLTMVLIAVMLVQTLGFGVSAMVGGLGSVFGGSSSSSVSGFAPFKSDEVIASLKKDLINSINKDLIKRVDEYELSGAVDVIISFSDDSLVNSFASSKDADRMTLGQYRIGSKAQKLTEQLKSRQAKVLNSLYEKGIIDQVRYQYLNIMDGACVSTSYERLEQLCNAEGVERVMLSNTYEACAAVENPVDVYDTGIFNSSDISFTGKGTIVAILDTGCDYNHTAFTTHTVQSPLYDRDDIAERLDKTVAYSYHDGLEVRQVYYGNITGGKIAFGYDYADKDPDIMPFNSEHGTHVAGIIGGKDDNITGVAIDTQFAIMKVFSDYEQGAEDADILAALEDSVILGVDAINMSLGASCGFSREADDEYKNSIYDSIEAAGISLVVAASNDYSSGFGSEEGNTNKTDNPDSATVGSPGTYDAAFTVASINGEKDKYMLANGDKVVFYNDSFDMASDEYDLFEMLGIQIGEKVTYEYVAVPGVGMQVNYAGIDVNGKIALVQRGDITFEEKVQFAQEAGAIAVVIYNNVFGDILMTIGNFAKIPAVSIGKDEGEMLAAQGSGTIEFDLSNVAGPFMSDFSSWGPTPDLKLKPEITAHGGNIYSATLGNEYDKLSGTSMAAPNMCGITVLIRQYVKERYPDMKATDVRDMVNQLTMSTATIALDKNGNPYSPRKQGAGIADIARSTTTPAYLFVEGIGKTKLELGDDPERKGVYTMSISLKNISDKAQSYRLGNIAMTESISTSDPEYVSEMAYLLSATSSYKAEGGSLKDGVLTVDGGKTATVTLTLTLSKEDKAYINSTFANGMYVEGFITFTNMEENGVDLNAPFLAFYGDWGEAPLFDLDYYEVETEAHDNSIDDDDKIKADYYATTPLGSYYYDYILPLGTYLYTMDESKYSPIPATREHAAVSYYAESISGVYGVFAGMLRGAKELNISVVNATTGEVVWTDTEYNCYKSHYGGAPLPYSARMELFMADAKTGQVFGHNNEKFEVTLSAKLDWDGGDNDSDTYSFSFYVDYQPPSLISSSYRTEYDKSRKENRYYLDLVVHDNHYAMSARPVVLYEEYNEFKQEIERVYSSLGDDPIPIYQQERGGTAKVSIEITDYLDLIAASGMPNGVTVYVDDYALNASVFYIPFPETDSEDLEFSQDSVDLDIGETADLTQLFMHKDSAEPVETDYLKTLKWYIKDENGEVDPDGRNDVVALNGGRIEALGKGTATIMVTSDSWVTPTKVAGEYVNVPIYKSIVINVSDQVVEDDPLAGANVLIEDVKFTSYKTLFAFNSDIDWSAIGRTGSTNYFGGSTSIECYPSEQIQLSYQLDPWNFAEDRYELIWSSSNPNVATVDENGVVTAESEGNARITLQVKIGDKVSLLSAKLSVEVKSEFVIENRTLIAYKGKGGEVVIPDDEGLLYIGSFAFSHFNLDNEKEVEKDENGYYDMDEKKTPIGNNTVTSVVIPENVETIQKYAFYDCNKLSKVTLPSTCKNIEEYAFSGCELLESVNFDKVKIISNYAFAGCESLSCESLGGPALSGVYAMGDYAFAKTRFECVDLSTLSRIGVGVFSDCAKLYEVTLGKRTRVMDKMFENTAVKSIVIYGDMVADSAFAGCTELESVVIKNDVTYVGDSCFKGCTSLESFTAEGVVEQIASYAFYGCSSLESFTFPNCTVAIGDAVLGETGVSSITFGEKTVLSTVGISLLEGATSVSAELGNSESYKLVDGVIYSKDGKTVVLALPSSALTSYEVPAEVTKIADGAFSSAYNLASLSFADGSALTAIGDNAFANCTKLSSVELPAQPLTLGALAFYGTKALSAVDLTKVTSLGDFAFAESGIRSAALTSANVTLGTGAFLDCAALRSVKLGAGAVIGESAFETSGVSTVELEGDATIGDGAFFECTSLSSFDFADVVGKIGDLAFQGCTKLSTVNAPKVTEIGKGAFADCYALTTFVAPAVVKVGESAFSFFNEQAEYANKLQQIELPAAQFLGENAFYGSMYLTSVSIPSVKELGMAAFGFCTRLESITLSTELKALPDYLFYADTKLTVPDLSAIETIGEGTFYGVKLPTVLNLDNVISIGMNAFYEGDEETNLVEVHAPKLTTLGDQAFVGITTLKVLDAPKLQTVGAAALAYTGIEELEISSAFKSLGIAAFEGCADFKAFYAKVDGQKVYDFDPEDGSIVLKDGVLYREVKNGYALVCYPAAKEGTEITVLDGTVKIDFCAVYDNKNVEKVILPATLKAIANYAFAGCENLKTVEFKSYYAPVLEGTLTGDAIEITPDNQDDFPGFDMLYGHDYFYKKMYQLGHAYYYNIFKGIVGSKDAQGLTAIVPDNCTGYDALLYKAYFTISEQTGGVTVGKYAVDFIDAVNKLPESVDRFDRLLVEDAIVAYNALKGHKDEMGGVSDDIIAKYERLCSEYNVDVVEDKIAHLFDMAVNKYSFDLVKDANASFLALSSAEQARVENSDRLTAKIAELEEVFGCEIDFSKNYADYAPQEPPVDEPPVDDDPDGLQTWVIVLIIVLSVAVVAGGAVVVFILIKKKRA